MAGGANFTLLYNDFGGYGRAATGTAQPDTAAGRLRDASRCHCSGLPFALFQLGPAIIASRGVV
jgi:hypothetical protein